MNRQPKLAATTALAVALAGLLVLGACDGKSPNDPGNPLPPSKPPTPKVDVHGGRLMPAIWWVEPVVPDWSGRALLISEAELEPGHG